MRRTLKVITIIIVVGAGAFVLLFSPIDRSPLEAQDLYHSMLSRLDSLTIETHPSGPNLLVGWSRENIIPDFMTPMAGYGPRKRYKEIHDSLFVQAIVLDNGSAKVAIITYDLLIVPPLLEKRLQAARQGKIPDIDFIYTSASHTHNGIGGWEDSPGGQLMAGAYNEKVLDHLEHQTLLCVRKAEERIKPSELHYYEAPAGKYVMNRLAPGSKEDGIVRGIEVVGSTGEKAILATFSAHATNIPSKSRVLSADYPGQLRLNLEQNGYDFAMFMAGTVGSHRLDSIQGASFERIREAGEQLSGLILNHQITDTLPDHPAISFHTVAVELGSSQMRLFKDFHLRDWVFRLFFPPLEAEIKYLKIGDLLLLGMPCDFSGEISIEKGIYKMAERTGKKLIITSFNGDYIGYITEDRHYDEVNKQEVRAMNWVGPHYGDYFTEIVKELIEK